MTVAGHVARDAGGASDKMADVRAASLALGRLTPADRGR
jgi:hypothetical protein